MIKNTSRLDNQRNVRRAYKSYNDRKAFKYNDGDERVNAAMRQLDDTSEKSDRSDAERDERRRTKAAVAKIFVGASEREQFEQLFCIAKRKFQLTRTPCR